MDSFLRWSLVSLAAVAICSATHDVAADGFYLLALSSHEQAWFVGIRSIAYRIATIAGNGPLVMLAGMLESSTGLPTLNIDVRAVDHTPAAIQFTPNEFKFADSADTQRVLLAQSSYEISFKDRPAAEVKKLQEEVRAWNVSHGFYAAPEQKESNKNRSEWLVKLEDFIKRQFGPSGEVKKGGQAGDVAVLGLRLAKPVEAGDQQTVQFGRLSGDASFKVIEGERFVVTEANWKEPFAAIVQVDAKLDEPSEATFDVRSGNLPFAWSVTFFVVASVVRRAGSLSFRRVAAAGGRRQRIGANRRANWLAGFLVPFVDFFRKPRIFAILAFLLVLSISGSTFGQVDVAFPARHPRGGRPGADDRPVRRCLRHHRRVHASIGRPHWRISSLRATDLGRWLWPMALAIHLPNLAFLFSRLCPTRQYLDDNRGRGDRAVWLRVWVYCLFAVLRLRGDGQTRDRALRAVHRLHGAGHDVPRHVERLAARPYRLSTFLRVDHDRDDSQLVGGGDDSGRPDVWQEDGRRVG